jgi:cytochrome oxidase assembly protein ShyY1
MTARALFFATLGLLLAGLAAPQAGAQTTEPDYDIPGGHFYTQTNGGVGAQYGYRITDEGGIGFWSEFKRLGGVDALGYPVSQRFMLDGFMVQATQKVIMQWRPDVNPPQVYFVNVFDKLHDMGLDSTLQQQYQIPPQADPSIDQNTRLSWLNADPAIAARYNLAGPLAILYGGLPTSQITPEGPFSMLRAQRVAIQHWTAANPAAGIKAGDVTVVNGGDVAKALGLVPASAAAPQTASGQPAPSSSPTPAVTATPTSQFEYQSKPVTSPPVDCSVGNDVNGNPTSSIPCVSVAPNAGTQYIKGRVMDQKGNHLQFVPVEAVQPGVTCQNGQGQTLNPCILTTTTAGDGTFTFFIANGPPGSTVGGANTQACPPYALTYQIFVTTNTGQQDSDVYTVHYDGNCNSDGEFHFDFVKVR